MQEAIKDLKMSLRMWGRKPQKESYEKAIRSLEAWDAIRNYIRTNEDFCDDGILADSVAIAILKEIENRLEEVE